MILLSYDFAGKEDRSKLDEALLQMIPVET